MNSAGAFFLCQPERLTNHTRNHVHVDDLAGVLGQGTHHVHDVHDLKLSLFALLDGLLSRDHQHREGSQLGIGRGGHQVGRSRPQCRETNTGLACQPSIGGRHEPGSLFMAGENQPDARLSQCFQEVQILFTGHAVNNLDALVFESLDEQIGRVHRISVRRACSSLRRCHPQSPSQRSSLCGYPTGL